MDISLTFVNQSNTPSTDVVIFQKNLASRAGGFAVAWKLFKDSVPGSSYPFAYPVNAQVAAEDDFGNITPLIDVSNGQLYRVYNTDTGNQISGAGPAANKANIQVRNDLPIGNINVNAYRDGNVVSAKAGVAPQQKALFQFKPTIWIGAVSQIQQGQIMTQAILSDINTEIALLGIAKADIVMTGGGVGTSSQLLKFELANIVFSQGFDGGNH